MDDQSGENPQDEPNPPDDASTSDDNDEVDELPKDHHQLRLIPDEIENPPESVIFLQNYRWKNEFWVLIVVCAFITSMIIDSKFFKRSFF